MTSSPAEERLSEVVLGSILWLHPSLQQHLLVKLPLLLLLFQMLLHTETLPIKLLYVLCGVTTLDKYTHAHSKSTGKMNSVRHVFAIDVKLYYVVQ